MRALVVCGVWLGGCGDDTLSLRDYNTSCVATSDCVAVYIGDVCDCADRCPNAAIHQASYSQYKEDDEATRCGLTETKCRLPERCPAVAPLCINMRCQLPELSGGGDDGGVDR